MKSLPPEKYDIQDILERLEARTFRHQIMEPKHGKCWCCTGWHDGKGYREISISNSDWLVHRISWMIFHGEIRGYNQIDHVCMIRGCWNPDHLLQVTPAAHNKLTHYADFEKAKRLRYKLLSNITKVHNAKEKIQPAQAAIYPEAGGLPPPAYAGAAQSS